MNIFSKEYYNDEIRSILIDGICAEYAAANDSTVKIMFQFNCKDASIHDFIPITIHDLLDNFVYPEIMRRVESNLLSSDFKPHSVHIILYSDPKRNTILFNENVRFKIHVEFLNGKKFKVGELVDLKDVKEIFGIYPSEKNDPNAAHVIMIKFRGIWLIACDLIYDRKRVKQRFKTAIDFLRAADVCKKEKLWGPFVDNLFSATELAIQSILLLQRHPTYSLNQSHEKTRELFSSYSSLGNIDIKFPRLYDRLIELRNKGRYLNGVKSNNHILNKDEAIKLFSNSKELTEFVEKLLKVTDLLSKPTIGEYVLIGRF